MQYWCKIQKLFLLIAERICNNNKLTTCRGWKDGRYYFQNLNCIYYLFEKFHFPISLSTFCSSNLRCEIARLPLIMIIINPSKLIYLNALNNPPGLIDFRLYHMALLIIVGGGCGFVDLF